jgi:hypothetical protein
MLYYSTSRDNLSRLVRLRGLTEKCNIYIYLNKHLLTVMFKFYSIFICIINFIFSYDYRYIAFDIPYQYQSII